MGVANPDFSGYATKAGLKCTDGRTITAEAFKHMDGMQVPLVWQHGHNSPDNVLGHAVLEARSDGMYCHGYFNGTKSGKSAKALVMHKDVDSLSIYANQLVEKAKQVLHGIIREVSLVLSGANPGAKIDYVAVQHGDGEVEQLEDEAVIYTGLSLIHSAEEDSDEDSDEDEDEDEGGEAEHAATSMTVQEIYDTMNDDQKNVVSYMVGVALEQGNDAVAQSGTEPTEDEAASDESALAHQEGQQMTKNVFDQTDEKSAGAGAKHTLTHDGMRSIVKMAIRGGSLREAVNEYALKHGIDNIEVLFPDAKNVNDRPEFDKRRTEWVDGVLGATKHSPFSRIKSVVADITLDEARARGYVKGNFKKEEWFGLSKRVTTPTTVYKKQKLDRDDIIDITDFDVVAWMKAEMNVMFREELARAILIGDGRDVSDEDKIKDPAGANEGAGIRSILNDHDLYATTINVNLDDASSSYTEVIESLLRGRKAYKGSGNPTLYTTDTHVVNMLLLKDTLGRRLYNSMEDLRAALMVSSIVTVEVLETEPDLVGIIVNLADYTIGADKGGEVSLFDDFDIDYNQYKYLMESRLSGALTKIRSALIIKKVASTAVLTVPAAPTQVDDEVTVTNTTGVVYKIKSFSGAVTYNATQVDVGDTVTASYPIVLADGARVTVEASPASSSYYLADTATDQWSFVYHV